MGAAESRGSDQQQGGLSLRENFADLQVSLGCQPTCEAEARSAQVDIAAPSTLSGTRPGRRAVVLAGNATITQPPEPARVEDSRANVTVASSCISTSREEYERFIEDEYQRLRAGKNCPTTDWPGSEPILTEPSPRAEAIETLDTLPESFGDDQLCLGQREGEGAQEHVQWQQSQVVSMSATSTSHEQSLVPDHPRPPLLPNRPPISTVRNVIMASLPPDDPLRSANVRTSTLQVVMQDLAKKRLNTTSARGPGANLRTEPAQHQEADAVQADTVQPDPASSTQTSSTERHFPCQHISPEDSSINDKSSHEQTRNILFKSEPTQHDTEIKSPHVSSRQISARYSASLADLRSLQLVSHSPRRGFTSPSCDSAGTELTRASADHCWVCQDDVGGDVVKLRGNSGRLLCSRCRALTPHVDSAQQRN